MAGKKRMSSAEKRKKEERTAKKKKKRSSSKKLMASSGGKTKLIRIRILTLKRQAEVEFITDPEERSVDWHYYRDDRDYTDVVSVETFRKWAQKRRWVEKRKKFWEDVEADTLEKLKDKIVKQRVVELRKMESARSYMEEYLFPVSDSDGNVMRDEATGLPVYGLDLPSYDRFVKMWLELDDRIAMKRGEVKTRTEMMDDGSRKVSVTSLDPAGSIKQMTRSDIRGLAKAMIAKKQEKEVIDVAAEEEDGGDEGDEEI